MREPRNPTTFTTMDDFMSPWGDVKDLNDYEYQQHSQYQEEEEAA